MPGRGTKNVEAAMHEDGTVGRSAAHMNVVHLGRNDEEADVLIRRGDWDNLVELRDKAMKGEKQWELVSNNMPLAKFFKVLRKLPVDYVNGEQIQNAITLEQAELQERLNREQSKARNAKAQAESKAARRAAKEKEEQERGERMEDRREQYGAYLAAYSEIPAELREGISTTEQRVAYAAGVHDRKQQQKPKSFTELTEHVSKLMQ